MICNIHAVLVYSSVSDISQDLISLLSLAILKTK